MERQIIINYCSNKIDEKINHIIQCLNLMECFNGTIACNFSLYNNNQEILEKLKTLKGCEVIQIERKRQAVSKEEYFHLCIVVSFEIIEKFLQIIEKHELNIVMFWNKIKIFLNDNDGDFIIIDSKDSNYNKLKKFIKDSRAN